MRELLTARVWLLLDDKGVGEKSAKVDTADDAAVAEVSVAAVAAAAAVRVLLHTLCLVLLLLVGAPGAGRLLLDDRGRLLG